MSWINGHYDMTREAVRQLSMQCHGNAAVLSIAERDTATAAILIDMVDIATRGHWRPEGQRHHFMRRQEHQTERAAYDESSLWVRTNALEAARELQPRIERSTRPRSIERRSGASACRVPSVWARRGAGLLAGSILPSEQIRVRFALGNACHAAPQRGWAAVVATRDLLALIVTTAVRSAYPTTVPAWAPTWGQYKTRFLAATPDLLAR